MQTSFELTTKQAEYIRNSTHRWNVACGAVRSGKSYCQIAYCIPHRLIECEGKKGLRVILGATRENIERNILQPMRDIYGEGVASAINSRNYAKILGEKVYCIGADNVRQVRKIRGSEIAYCAVDEAIDLNEDVFEMLKSRLSLPWSCADITTNPAGPNHWFKKFLDSKEQGVDIYEQDYSIYDNPFLPLEYIHALEIEYAGSMRFDRYILGKWTQAEGLVYPNFAMAITDEIEDSPMTECAISLDYGTSNPFAGILWEKHGRVWTGVRELYYSGRDTGVQKTDDEYLKMLTDWAKDHIKTVRYGNPVWGYTEEIEQIPVIIDPSAASFHALLRQSEFFRPIDADNDVLEGIRETNTAIFRGLIKIHSQCKNCEKEFQSYVWDKDSIEDRPIKMFDHLMDCIRYFVRTKRITKALEEYQSKLGG